MNIHFVKIGEKLSSNIKCSHSGNFTQFLGKKQVLSMYLRPTDAFEVVATWRIERTSYFSTNYCIFSYVTIFVEICLCEVLSR